MKVQPTNDARETVNYDDAATSADALMPVIEDFDLLAFLKGCATCMTAPVEVI